MENTEAARRDATRNGQWPGPLIEDGDPLDIHQLVIIPRGKTVTDETWKAMPPLRPGTVSVLIVGDD